MEIMEKLRQGIDTQFSHLSQSEKDYLYILILGRLVYGDIAEGNLESIFRWANTAGNPHNYFPTLLDSNLPAIEQQRLMFGTLGITEDEYKYMRYRIRMQNNIASNPDFYLWEKAVQETEWKEFMRKAYGYSEEEFTQELYEKLWNEMYDDFCGKGDYGHFAITLATNLRTSFGLADLHGGKDKINQLSGWRGDATNEADIFPNLDNDDYIADLDAANIAYLVKRNGTPLIKTLNSYYHSLSADYTRADAFVEHTSVDEVKKIILDSAWVNSMEDLKEKWPDSYRFIRNLEEGNSELEEYE